MEALISCRQTTSGCALSIHSRNWVWRARIPFTFQVAIFMSSILIARIVSLPSEDLQPDDERNDAPDRQYPELKSDLRDAGGIVDDRAQRVIQQSQRQDADEWFDRIRKTFVREEDAGAEPHRHHDQIHQPAHRFDRFRTRRRQEADSGEGIAADD